MGYRMNIEMKVLGPSNVNKELKYYPKKYTTNYNVIGKNLVYISVRIGTTS